MKESPRSYQLLHHLSKRNYDSSDTFIEKKILWKLVHNDDDLERLASLLNVFIFYMLHLQLSTFNDVLC